MNSWTATLGRCMEKGETNLRNQLGVDLQPDSVSVSVVQPRCFAKGGSFALGCVEKTKRMESDLDECPLIGLETLFQCRLPPIKRRVTAIHFQ